MYPFLYPSSISGAFVVGQVDAINNCENLGCCIRSVLCSLQFLSDSFIDQCTGGNGSQDHNARLGFATLAK
jgi:hypothetical protein